MVKQFLTEVIFLFQSNSSQGAYDEISGEPQHHQQQQHHHGHQQQQPHYHQQQCSQSGEYSPRHSAAPKSPGVMFGSDPQSPSHGANRPFSYGAPVLPVLSPKHTPDRHVELKHVPNHNNTQNGHRQLSQSPVIGRQVDNQAMAGSPATHYGKHESVFQPNPHRPAPHVPPPPPPGNQGQGQPHYPGHSPAHMSKQTDGSTRRPSAQQSPKLTPKLSQRSQSVPCHPEYMPAPPPPLTVKDNYLAAAQQAYRPPSPPLPPPPPEMLEDLPHPHPPAAHQTHQSPQMHNMMSPAQQQQMFQQQQQNHPQLYQQQQHSQSRQDPHDPYLEPAQYLSHPQQSPPQRPPAGAPPPPPLSSIPRRRAEDQIKGSNPNVGPNAGVTQTVTKPVLPEPKSKESSPARGPLLKDISKVQLKKTGRFDKSFILTAWL